MKVGLDVGILRHQVERIRGEPKIPDKIVIIVESVLISLIIMMLLVFCREKILLPIKTRFNVWREPITVERSKPVIRSEEIPEENDKPRGAIEVKTPDRSRSSPLVLYHKGSK